MPLFYFDIEARGVFTPDEEGQSFPNADAAKGEAAKVAAQVVREMELDSLSIIVRDEWGDTVGVAEALLRIGVSPPHLQS
jgi:hypothetical protein